MLVRQHEKERAGRRVRDLALDGVDRDAPDVRGPGRAERGRVGEAFVALVDPVDRRRRASPAASRSRGRRGRRRTAADERAARSPASAPAPRRRAARARSVTAPPQHWPSAGPSANDCSLGCDAPLASIARAVVIAFSSRCPPPIVPTLRRADQHARADVARHRAARRDDLDDDRRPAVGQPLGGAIAQQRLAHARRRLHGVDRAQDRLGRRRRRAAADRRGARRPPRPRRGSRRRPRTAAAAAARRPPCCGGSSRPGCRRRRTVLPEAHVEDRRAVVGGRDLVGARRVREEQPAGAAVFGCQTSSSRRQPAHALDEAALDLADVDRRVERLADVVQQVGAQQPPLAGERVDDDLAHRGAVGEVEERVALHRLAVPATGRAWRRSRRTRAARAPGRRRRRARERHRLRRADRDLAVGEAHRRRRRRRARAPRTRPAARGSGAPRPAPPCRSGRCRSTPRWPRCWRPCCVSVAVTRTRSKRRRARAPRPARPWC